MTNIFHKKINSSVLALTFGVVLLGGFSTGYSPQAVAAKVYCTNCSTFYTQALEHGVALKTYAETATTAIQTQLTAAEAVKLRIDAAIQAATLPGTMIGNAMSDIQEVTNMYHNVQSLGRDFASIEQQFQQTYKGYGDYLNHVRQSPERQLLRYQNWSSSGLDNARVALKASGYHVQSFESETEILNKVLKSSQTATGRMQAMQAANELAAQNVQQIQKLRDMVATQINLQANFAAAQTERAAVDDAITESFTSVPVNNSQSKEY